MSDTPSTGVPDPAPHDESALRRQNAVLIELSRRPVVRGDDLDATLREIAETAAAELEVDRVSVWLFTPQRQAIRCAELFERSRSRHSGGDELTAVRYPAYFRALQTERVLVVHDARRDTRTSAFTSEYLAPHSIVSMLDAPVRRLGEMKGVVCFEQTTALRSWSPSDEAFAISIADLVAMALDAAERREVLGALRRRAAFEQVIAGISTRLASHGPDDLDDAIRESLRDIGEFVGAERVHTIILTPDGLGGRMTHEWSRSGSDFRTDVYGELPAAAFPWWITTMQQASMVAFTSVDELPPVAVNERQLFLRQGIRSGAFVPMRMKDKLVGTVGASTLTHEVQWSEETIALLRLAGEIFASAIERNRAYTALRASEKSHRMLFERNLAGVYHVTLDGRIVDCNEALAKMLGYTKDELMKVNARELYFDRSERDGFIDAVLRHGGIPGVEVRLRRKDGRPVWLLESVHLVGEEGEPRMLEGTVVDITDRKLAETALRESEARYRLMADNATDLISRTTRDGVIVYASEAAATLVGYEPEELEGKSVFDLVVEDDHHVIRRSTSEIEHEGVTRTFSYRVRRKDGSLVWFETTSRAIFDPKGGRIDEIVSVSRDISERRNAEAQIEYQAYHDALTELPNRLLFRDRLTIALAHAKRLEAPLAVMFLDLDRFKFVNDTLGHSVGDELLRIVADRLRNVVREGDTIARMGGDEFTILLTDLAAPDDAAKVAQKILDAVMLPLRLDGHELYVTTSIGIALYPDDGATAEALLKNADTAMYRAKEAGRNSYQLCTRAMNARAAERLSVENALRRAIERDELVIHYQPLINLDTGETAGMEALLRWQRPGHGLVPPSTFIGIAEDTRMIVSIGEWVLRRACTQAKAWQAGGKPQMRISVNLSPRQFQQANLLNVVSRALEDSGLEGRYLELEITETTAMLDIDRTIATLLQLRELGVRIAVDDFGTGHSSLNYLRHFAIDRVKIDREFVREIETSRSNRAIVSAVVALAHGLDLFVTAEGVETEAQLQFLREQKCEEAQGFLFGRPAPVA